MCSYKKSWATINDWNKWNTINDCTQNGTQYNTNLELDEFYYNFSFEFESKKIWLTIKSTPLELSTYLDARDQNGMYGSLSRVTGLIRDVFTDVSNSGRGSSSLSVPCKSHSHTNTDCFRFHNSRNVVANSLKDHENFFWCT